MMDQYEAQLRAQGFRLTPQRLVILRLLNQAGGHLTPQEVCRQAQQLMPGLTEATVYRTLTFLAEQRLVNAAHIGSGQLVYEIAGHAHHHLVCRSCGQTHEVSHNLLESLYDQFHLASGYQIDCVHVTFFGLCPQCQNKPAGTTGTPGNPA